jgi:prepilin-type N-terminal cleavage/methylation domain-containing protein
MALTAPKAARVRTQTSGADRCRGFTLLEVLLVCILLALAVSLTASYLTDSGQKQFMVNLGQISAHLRNARRQAIITGSEQVLLLATVVAEEPAPDEPLPVPPDWINEDMQLHFAATLDDPLEELSELERIFFPMGSSTGGLIQLTDGERESYLYIDPLTGRLMLETRLDDLEDRLQDEGV